MVVYAPNPAGWFFLGIPIGALLVMFWLRAQIRRAAEELKKATDLHYHASEIYRKVNQEAGNEAKWK